MLQERRLKIAAAKPKLVSNDDDGIRGKLGVQLPEESISYINQLIYGEPGSGKTTYSGTAADHEMTAPALLLDIEGGTLSLRGKTIDVIQARTMKAVNDALDELEKDKGETYKTVILDSGTELQKLDMRAVMQAQYDRRPETTDIYVPSQREWGKSNERMRQLVRRFRDLPVNTIITCLVTTEKDDRTNRTSYFPSLPGKLRSEVPGFFDIVGFLRAKDEQDGEEVRIVRTLQVARTEAVVAKDRTNTLGNVVREPTIPMLWDLIHAK